MTLIRVLQISALMMLIGLGALGAQGLQKLERLQRIERPQQVKTKLTPALAWTAGRLVGFTSANRAKGVRADNSIIVQGTNPESDTYTVYVETDLPNIHGLRIEALTLPSLGGGGPGRTPHGNFVLSEVSASVAPKTGGD